MNLPQPQDRFAQRYLIKAELGRGGMGAVYLATDLATEQDVALKVLLLRGQDYDRVTLSRYQREVDALSKLRSPHNVRMLGYGEDPGGLRYIAFEFVDGEDLQKALRRVKRFAPGEARRILVHVLRALDEAHQLGLLHRDVKPANIRLRRDGDRMTAILLDYGIARTSVSESERTQLTKQGELVGTPRYMSPEQLTDQKLGPASDIYSLGLVGYEMLMGSDSLQGGNWEHQVERLQSGHVFALPDGEGLDDLATIIPRMAARKVSDRYTSARAVLAELSGGATYDHAISQRPEVKSERHTPWIWVGAALLAFALAAFGIFALTKPPEPAPVVAKPRVVPGALLKSAEPLPAVVAEPSPPADAGPDVSASAEEKSYPGCHTKPGLQSVGARGQTLAPATRRVYIPSDFAPGRPLVLLFHEDGQTTDQILDATGLDRIAEQKGFAIYMPKGGAVAWRSTTDTENAAAGTEEVIDALCIDPKRVFGLGHGPGGRGAVKLHCASDLMTAVATTAYRRESQTARCAKPIHRIHVTPLLDTWSPIEPGAGGCKFAIVPKISLEEQEDEIRETNDCGETRTSSFVYEGSECWTFSCRKAEFETCHIDGGRGWKGAPPRAMDLGGCDGPNSDFPIGERVWDFFERVAIGDE